MKRWSGLILGLTAVAVLYAGCAWPGGPGAGQAPAGGSSFSAAPTDDRNPGAAPTETTVPVPAPPEAEPPPAVAPDPRQASRPEGWQLLVYRPADLLAGKHEPGQVVALPDDRPYGISFSPDGRNVLLFPTIGEGNDRVYRIDLDTGQREVLTPPEPYWYAFLGWLPDGRLLAVGGGGGIWLADAPGAEWRAVAEVGLTWTVAPSPSWRYLALWGPAPGGEISVVDLETARVQRLPGPFRRCAQDGGLALAWSPDGRLLAGSDCDTEAFGGPRIRIIDPQAGREVRTIEGPLLVSWLTTGDLVGVRNRDGQPYYPLGDHEHVFMNATGEVKQVFPGQGRPALDGRYHIQWTPKPREIALVDRLTAERLVLDLPAVPRWNRHGDLYLTVRPQS